MKLKVRCFLLVSAILVMVFVYSFYFVNKSATSQNDSSSTRVDSILNGQKSNFESALKARIETKLKEKSVAQLFRVNHDYERKVDVLLANLKCNNISVKSSVKLDHLWNIAEKWVKSRELFPEIASELPVILRSLATGEITKADVTKKGTQLKLELRLKGGQFVFFKPKRYNINELVRGTPYAGFDRHNGEIAAFQLSRLLGMRYVPIATGRRVHVDSEIKRVASQRLLRTFINVNKSSSACSHSLGTKTCSDCFYGECYYCSENRYVCPDEDGFLDGVIILLLPKNLLLRKYRNPWQRTYKKNILARWEQDPKYCVNTVMKSLGINTRILDLIDVAVFDYLIGNADRHHYEVFKNMADSAVLFFDNGKSFGNAYWDEFTILAPLYQCCLIRKSTYERLLLFAAVRKGLSGALNELLLDDALYPVLSEANLEAIDRRLKTVITLVHICLNDTNKVLF